MSDIPRGLLLPLPYCDALIVRDALHLYAIHQEAKGDPCGNAADAELIADRLREMLPLATTHADELLKKLGLGRYENRRQG